MEPASSNLSNSIYEDHCDKFMRNVVIPKARNVNEFITANEENISKINQVALLAIAGLFLTQAGAFVVGSAVLACVVRCLSASEMARLENEIAKIWKNLPFHTQALLGALGMAYAPLVFPITVGMVLGTKGGQILMKGQEDKPSLTGHAAEVKLDTLMGKIATNAEKFHIYLKDHKAQHDFINTASKIATAYLLSSVSPILCGGAFFSGLIIGSFSGPEVKEFEEQLVKIRDNTPFEMQALIATITFLFSRFAFPLVSGCGLGLQAGTLVHPLFIAKGIQSAHENLLGSDKAAVVKDEDELVETKEHIKDHLAKDKVHGEPSEADDGDGVGQFEVDGQ